MIKRQRDGARRVVQWGETGGMTVTDRRPRGANGEKHEYKKKKGNGKAAEPLRGISMELKKNTVVMKKVAEGEEKSRKKEYYATPGVVPRLRYLPSCSQESDGQLRC